MNEKNKKPFFSSSLKLHGDCGTESFPFELLNRFQLVFGNSGGIINGHK